YRPWEGRDDVSGPHHTPAIHRHCGEQRLCVQCAIAAAGVLEGTPAVERGGWLADQRQHRYPARERLAEPRHGVQATAARGRGHHAKPGAAAAIPVGHRGSGELVLGQDCGDVVTKERGVIEVLDVGAVHTEDVADAPRLEIPYEVIDNTMPSGHISPASPRPNLDTTLGGVRFTAWRGSQVLFEKDLPVIRRTQLHLSALVLLHRGCGARQRSSTAQPEPRRHLSVAAISAHHDH